MSDAWKVRGPAVEPNLPAGWEIRRVRELVKLTNGYPFPSEAFGRDGELPLVRIRDLASPDFEFYVSGRVPAGALLEDGDIVIGMDGDFNLITWDRGPAALNQRLCRLRAQRGIDSRFLAYALPATLKIINDLTFSTTVKHLSSVDLLAEIVPLPPLEEQRRIADFLDAETSRIDELVALTRVQLTVLAERRIVQVRQMTTRGAARVASPTGVPWMPRMASGWTLRKIGRTFKTGSGTTPRLDDERYCGDDIPWINTSDLRDGLVDVVKNSLSNEALRDHSALRVYEPGVLVVAMYGATVGRVGITGTSCCVNQACCVLYSPASLTTEYAYFWLLGFRGDILKMATGGGQPNISQDTVRSLRIPAPDVSTQREIVRFLEREEGLYRSKTELLNKRLELLAERKQALITAAVTGQIDVTSAGRATADLRA